MLELDGRNVILSIAFSQDGKHLVSGGWEGTIRRWQIQDGREVAIPIKTGPTISGISASKDGNWIVAGDVGVMVVLNAKTNEKVIANNGHGIRCVRDVDVSPDSSRFATASDDRTACIWCITTGQRLVGPMMHETEVIAVKYSPQGDRVATATLSSANSVRIFDSRNGQLLHILSSIMPIGHAYCAPLTWSNNGRLFIGSTGKIFCFDGLTGSLLSEWLIHNGGTHISVALSNTGKFIACSADHSTSFWDTSTRKRIGPIVEDPAPVYCIAITPDNAFLASGGGHNKITLRSLRDILPQRYFTSDTPLLRVSQDLFKPWMQQDWTNAETVLAEEMTRSSGPNRRDALVNRSLIRARLQRWREAYDDAEESLKIQPTVTGHIARVMSLVGKGKKEPVTRAVDLIFCDHDPMECDLKFLLLIKAIILFEAGKCDEAILRVQDLIPRVDNDVVYCYIQVLMNMRQWDYARTLESLELPQNLDKSYSVSYLTTISLMFGWNFDGLGTTN